MAAALKRPDKVVGFGCNDDGFATRGNDEDDSAGFVLSTSWLGVSKTKAAPVRQGPSSSWPIVSRRRASSPYGARGTSMTSGRPSGIGTVNVRASSSRNATSSVAERSACSGARPSSSFMAARSGPRSTPSAFSRLSSAVCVAACWPRRSDSNDDDDDDALVWGVLIVVDVVGGGVAIAPAGCTRGAEATDETEGVGVVVGVS